MKNKPERLVSLSIPIMVVNKTLQELAHLIRNDVPLDQSKESRYRLAQYLDELHRSRIALDKVRAAMRGAPE